MKKLSIFLILIAQAYGLTLTKDQAKVQHLIENEAPKHTKFIKWAVATGLTETSLGKCVIGDLPKDGNLEKASLGIMQVQVRTAKWIATMHNDLKWLTRLSNKHVATLLLRNDRLNIKIACRYINWIVENYGVDKLYYYNGQWEVENGKAVRVNGKRIKNVAYFKRVIKNLKLIYG